MNILPASSGHERSEQPQAPPRGQRAARTGGWTTWAALATLMALVVLGIVYRRFLLSGLDIVAEGTGSRATAALALVGVLLVVLCLVAWLLFPFLVYFGLRDLRRRTAELERHTESCARELARLNPARQPPQPSPPTADPPAGASPGGARSG